MKLSNLVLFISFLITSCDHPKTEDYASANSTTDSLSVSRYDEKQIEENKVTESEVVENEEPDTKELRKEYVSNYHKIEKIDSIFINNEGKTIHVQTKYYCLFDNAILVPKQYVWEDPTKTFLTHNYSQDILIIIDKDTIFNKTITKNTFEDNLYPALKNYAVLMFPNFIYDEDGHMFDFGYSISIPITDVGAGWSLLIDEKGNMSKTDK